MIPLFKVYMSEKVEARLNKTLYSGYIGQGPKVEEFECELRKFIGNPHCLTTNSGTSALHLALSLIGVKGGEVITSPMTCTATNWPILANGATPIWCDIDPWSGNIDPTKIEELINKKTMAIMVIHWGGMPCDMDTIHKIAKDYGVPVIEDAAHAFGASYRGRMVGSLDSDFTVFSFQAIKHLTAVDGGALFCKDPKQYKRGKLIRWYGIDRDGSRKDFRCEADITEWGYKFHLNDVAATIGLANLEDVGMILSKHRANAKFYDEALKGIPGVHLLRSQEDRYSAYWLYTIRVDRQEAFRLKMNDQSIMVSRVHERNDRHTCMGPYKRPLPGVDEFASAMMCIPVGWWVTEGERQYVVDTIKKGW